VASGEGQLKVQGWNLWQIRISYRLSTGTLRKSQSPVASAPETFANPNFPSLQHWKLSQIPISIRFSNGTFRESRSPIASAPEPFANPSLSSLHQRKLWRTRFSSRLIWEPRGSQMSRNAGSRPHSGSLSDWKHVWPIEFGKAEAVPYPLRTTRTRNGSCSNIKKGRNDV